MNGIQLGVKARFERLNGFQEMESEADDSGREIIIRETNKRV
jgi:hypothetical protein